MRVSSSFLASTAILSTANAAIKGFNYGAQFNNNAAKTLADFEYEFNAAKQLPGTDGWTSARLYTMIQHNTPNTIIEAIQAAINTNTTLLLGMWCSAGQEVVNNELAALKAAISQYGTAFTDLVVGISVGSEDLYRVTPTGIENKSGPGAQPDELVNYIQQTRNAIRGTPLEGKPIGHVDTWTVYVNASNNAVISALDFIGMDAYPYFQTTMPNGIGSASQLFFDAYQQTAAASQGKPVWVTETGWPVSGETMNQAVPSADNARTYWEDVTCNLVKDNVPLYYYILQDVQYGNPVPSFGIKPAGDLQQVQPLFDLSCPASANSTLPRTGNLTATAGGSIVRAPTRTAFLSTTYLNVTVSTIEPTKPTIPMTSPSSLPPAEESTTSLSLDSFPVLDEIPTELQAPFEAPYLIVPIDKADPRNVIRNGYSAQLTPTTSTVFVFDIHPEHHGKNCNLAFYMPPPFPFAALAPAQIRSPGGISVARLGRRAALAEMSTSSVGASSPVGSAPSIGAEGQYNIANFSCEAGQRTAYQVDSIGGLDMNFFQMISPPLGLFMSVLE